MNIAFKNPRQFIWRATKRIEKKIDQVKILIQQKTNQVGNPSLVSFPIIAQCNYRCNFCEIIGVDQHLKLIGGKYQRNQMSAEQVMQFSKAIRFAKDIDFGGLTALGEPFLATNFKDIIKTIRKINRRAVLLITTNAYLMNAEMTDFLLENSPAYINFSLHAATEDVYSRVMSNGFDKVIQNIRYFCAKASKKYDVGTAINFGLGKFNHMEAEEIVRLAKDLNVRSLNMYPYYKSPNKFIEDVSLYDNPDLANQALDAAYKVAREIGQKMVPPSPSYLRPVQDVQLSESTYAGGCPLPYKNLRIKSTPTMENKISLGVCNRIVLFTASLDKDITPEDYEWLWNHPAMNALRSLKEIPEICKFCKNPATPALRSLHQEEYKRLRDTAVKEHLSKWQENRVSPSGSIELLSKNIFSLE
jgi:wyosine [tRNA(Phe)-imidazoG37] synthetase (radical SAM superfamily)